MKKREIIAKAVISSGLLFILYLLLLPNIRLYYQPSINDYDLNEDIYAQLQYLKERESDGAANDMQDLFPEGYLFFEVLYGLAWCDLLESCPNNYDIQDQHQEGKREINRCIQKISSDYSKSVFDQDTPLEYGAFYNGWNAYLLGRKLEVHSYEQSPQDTAKFKKYCREIALALKESDSPFLETYINQCWPGDMTICMASLALHDRVFEPQYKTVCQDWVKQVKTKLDTNGLIPHSVTVEGKCSEPARGASQSLVLSFLPEIDSAFAQQQYQVFKQKFIEPRLGLNAVTEYPKGTVGMGDVDSGPVIWGIGTASTIVAYKACLKNKDYDMAVQLRNGIEAFGIPNYRYQNGKAQKYYLYGALDIGDAFIAWTRASDKGKNKSTTSWRTRFQLYTLLPCVVIILFFMVLWKPKKNV